MHKANADSIVLVRAEYVILYLAWLRRIGAPVDRELRRARLPTLLEEMPDAPISTALAYRFLMRSAASEGIEDLGFEAGWEVSGDALGETMTTALRASPTPRARLEAFARLLSLEDNGARCEIQSEGDMTRVCIRQYTPPGGDSRIAEWMNLKVVIEVIRSWMGADWLPSVIGLESRESVKNAIRDRLGGMRILSGQPVPFVMFPNRVMSIPIGAYDTLAATSGESCERHGNNRRPAGLEDAGKIEQLTAALAPYLNCGYPTIDIAAEIAGTSVRSLQRELSLMQTSYSGLIEGMRFAQAVRLLRDPNLKILEIALSLGYSDASNFSRACRRISGSSPRQLRRQWQAGE